MNKPSRTMTANSEPKDLKPQEVAPVSQPRKETPEVRERVLGEYVEGVLAYVLRTLSRFVSTIMYFAFRPHLAAAQISKESADDPVLVRPYTFLFLGCLFYSIVLGAFALEIAPHDESTRPLNYTDTTEALAAGIQRLLTEPSLPALVVTALPILIFTSLSAVVAGHIFKNVKANAKDLFLYLYGLQGAVILLFVLSMETQGEVLQTLVGSDDYVLLVVAALVVALAVQSLRCLRSILDSGKSSRRVVRALSYPAFAILFLVPMPLAGYTVVAMQQSARQVNAENRQRAFGPAVRIVDVTTPAIDGARISIEVIALVMNRTKLTLALRPADVTLEVYFISPEELNRVIQSSPGLPPNVDDDLDDYDRYRVELKDMQIEMDAEGRRIWTLAPTSERTIRVTTTQVVTSVQFLGHNRDRWRYKDDKELLWRLRVKREEPIRSRLKQVPELQRLGYVANDRQVIVHLALSDHAAKNHLSSGFYRLKN